MIVADKYVKVNKPANFRLTESDATDLQVDTCTFNFGNQTTKILSSEGSKGFLVPRTFRMAGDHSVMISCNTSEGALQDSILVQVSLKVPNAEKSCSLEAFSGKLFSEAAGSSKLNVYAVAVFPTQMEVSNISCVLLG